MKHFAVFAFLLLSFNVWSSDLTHDLKTKFEPRSNPFQGMSEKELSQDFKTPLLELLSSCAYQVVTKNEGFDSYEPATLERECLKEITPNYYSFQGRRYINNKLRIHTQEGLILTIVSWDADDSDGFDEQAIGVYNQNGKRIAVYPQVWADGNVVSGIMQALGENVRIVRH